MSRKGKYIIEIAERHTHYTDDGKAYNLYRVKGFNTLTFDDYGLDKLEKYDDIDAVYRDFIKLTNVYTKTLETALDIACGKLVANTFFTKEEMKQKILNEVSK